MGLSFILCTYKNKFGVGQREANAGCVQSVDNTSTANHIGMAAWFVSALLWWRLCSFGASVATYTSQPCGSHLFCPFTVYSLLTRGRKNMRSERVLTRPRSTDPLNRMNPRYISGTSWNEKQQGRTFHWHCRRRVQSSRNPKTGISRADGTRKPSRKQLEYREE